MTDAKIHRLVVTYTGDGCRAECLCGYLTERHRTQTAARRDLHYNHVVECGVTTK